MRIIVQFLYQDGRVVQTTFSVFVPDGNNNSDSKCKSKSPKETRFQKSDVPFYDSFSSFLEHASVKWNVCHMDFIRTGRGKHQHGSVSAMYLYILENLQIQVAPGATCKTCPSSTGPLSDV
jgi:hypothetical protein